MKVKRLYESIKVFRQGKIYVIAERNTRLESVYSKLVNPLMQYLLH